MDDDRRNHARRFRDRWAERIRIAMLVVAIGLWAWSAVVNRGQIDRFRKTAQESKQAADDARVIIASIQAGRVRTSRESCVRQNRQARATIAVGNELARLLELSKLRNPQASAFIDHEIATIKRRQPSTVDCAAYARGVKRQGQP